MLGNSCAKGNAVRQFVEPRGPRKTRFGAHPTHYGRKLPWRGYSPAKGATAKEWLSAPRPWP